MAEKRRDWESAALAGLMMALRAYKGRLTQHRNYKLNMKPREIDCVILDRLGNQAEPMDNAIARIFARHNIVELKNPYESLDIDIVWKVISYAGQYKSSGEDPVTGRKGVDAIPMGEVTITYLRLSRPDALFSYLRRQGYGVEEKFPGVYYLEGIADIRMQVVVGAELAGDEFMPLRVQKKNASDRDLLGFIAFMRGLDEPNDKDMADAILNISVSENAGSYYRLQEEDTDMRSVLREIMKDDYDRAKHYYKAYYGKKASREIRRATALADLKIEEASQKIAEADQKSVEADQKIAEADSRMEQAAKKMLKEKMPMSQILFFTNISEYRLYELAEELGITPV